MFDPEIDGEKLVSFLNFVTLLAVRSIRKSKPKISLKKIREAIEKAEEKYDISFPLARKHKILLFDNRDLVINVGSMSRRKYIQSSGKHKGARMMPEIAEDFIEDLSFDPEGLVLKYQPFHYRGYAIEMNPKIRFGEPIVTSCGYTARTLWDAYKDEGGIENAAKAYGVKPAEVRTAYKYFQKLTN